MSEASTSTPTPPAPFGRRVLLKGLGLCGAGALFSAARGAASEGATTGPIETRVVDLSSDRAWLTTEGLPVAGFSGGSSLGACLIVSGGGPQSAGPLQPLLRVSELRVAGGAQGLGPFAEDPGVASMVRGLTRALSLPNPVTLHAFSSRSSPRAPGDALLGGGLRLDWEAELRVGRQAALRPWLAGFHAWVVGELAGDGAFRNLTVATVSVAG
jgi:hypothetical protein